VYFVISCEAASTRIHAAVDPTRHLTPAQSDRQPPRSEPSRPEYFADQDQSVSMAR
jgi:hypothetical protein